MTARTDFDVVIIGSGVAGALIAHRLAMAKVKVLILEAGDEPREGHDRNLLRSKFASSWSKGQTSPYVGYVAPQPNASDSPAAAGYGRDYYVEIADTNKSNLFLSTYQALVGGAMWHWQGISIRMLPNDFKMKQVYGRGVDWPISYDDLEPWYSDAEHEIGVAGNPEMDSLLGANRSREFPMPEITPTYGDSLFSKALVGSSFAGAPIAVTSTPQARNSTSFDGRPACDGQGTCVPLCPTLAKYEALFHIQKAQRAGAELRSKSIVTRLELDGTGKINSVRYMRWDRTEGSATAKIFVLAGNGIESPKLLLLSSDQRSAGVANSSDLVGRNLMDHPIKISYALAKDPVYPFRGPPSTSGIETFRDGRFREKSAAFRVTIRNDGWAFSTWAPRGRDLVKDQNFQGTLLDFVGKKRLFGESLKQAVATHTAHQILLYSAVEMLPSTENRVLPSPDLLDRFGIRRPVIKFRIDDYAQAGFRMAADLHSFIFDRMEATERHLHLNPSNPVEQDFGSGHIIGTTVMGDDAKTSVVDRECRSHDSKNLFIVGSSVFPTASAANPTMTIAALALRAASTIVHELS
jgi:glucose dehydrogenase